MLPKNLQDFNAWAESNKELVKQLAITLWGRYDAGIQNWLAKEGTEIRAWLLTHPERHKKDWRKFTYNWLRKSWNEMTVGEEGHYELTNKLNWAYKRIAELEEMLGEK